MRRREFIGGSASLMVGGVACPAAGAFDPAPGALCSPGDPGCDRSTDAPRNDPYALQFVAFDELEELAQSRLETTIGDSEIDRRISRFGWQIQRYVGGLGFNPPAIYYFNDGSRPRAQYWNVSTRLPGGVLVDGVVTLGTNYIRTLLSASANQDAAVFGILSHEMAHLSQYRWDLKRLLDGWRGGRLIAAELHADLVAGFIWGQFPIFNDFRLDQHFIAATERAGDNQFTCKNHHGTALQRSEALRRGFEMRSGAFSWSEQIAVITEIMAL